MNLLRKRAPTFFYFFVNKPKQNFVGLKSEVITALKEVKSPKRFYENLLRETPLNTKGLLNLQAAHFLAIVNKCKNENDINLAISAYYNFLGHQVFFTCSEIDKFLRKAIECKNPQATLEIIKNHNYLMYYPHPDVLAEIMKYYRSNKLAQDAKNLVELGASRKLLKFNARFFEQAILLSNEAESYNDAFLTYDLSLQHKFEISEKSFKALINCLYKFGTAHQDKRNKIRGLSKIIERLEKYNLSPEDWIKVSFSQLGHLETALGVLERFAERDFKAGEKHILPASDLNKEYFNALYQKIGNNNKNIKRLSDVLDLLGEKYGNYAIESELRQVIQDAEKGAKEAPVETKKEETTESNVQEEEKPTQEEEAKS